MTAHVHLAWAVIDLRNSALEDDIGRLRCSASLVTEIVDPRLEAQAGAVGSAGSLNAPAIVGSSCDHRPSPPRETVCATRAG